MNFCGFNNLSSELGIFLSQPLVVYCDSLGATYLLVNPIMHSQIKYMDIDYHFIHDQIQAKALQIYFFFSKD